MTDLKFQEILIADKKWTICSVSIDFKSALFLKAKEQAKLKSQYTMTYGQDSIPRTMELKYQKQLMGTIAEIYCQFFLSETLKECRINSTWSIVRYDDIRTDSFKSPVGEYDIKITDGASFNFTVESRSSIIYNRTIAQAIRDFHILGPYSSLAKKGEGFNDVYIRPIYFFIPMSSEKYDSFLFESYLYKGKLNLLILGGCGKRQMKDIGYDTALAQSGTTYRVVNIRDGYDAKQFKERICLFLSVVANSKLT